MIHASLYVLLGLVIVINGEKFNRRVSYGPLFCLFMPTDYDN